VLNPSLSGRDPEQIRGGLKTRSATRLAVARFSPLAAGSGIATALWRGATGDANFAVRICHLCHLKSPERIGSFGMIRALLVFVTGNYVPPADDQINTLELRTVTQRTLSNAQ
jgi:hypothetical protein